MGGNPCMRKLGVHDFSSRAMYFCQGDDWRVRFLGKQGAQGVQNQGRGGGEAFSILRCDEDARARVERIFERISFVGTGLESPREGIFRRQGWGRGIRGEPER